MSDLISVIIPVYNVEKYLRQCLDSVINQTYKNLEIILVDDGSTDNSGKICDEYADKDCRIRVIKKENSGQSEARNVGINNCHGKYIAFVDSDDWIDVRTYEVLHKYAVETEADIVACGLQIEHLDYSLCKYINDRILVYELRDKEVLVGSFLQRKTFSSSPCNKLYDINIFDNIRFPVGKVYEDNYIALEIIIKANKVVVIDQSYYHYRQNLNSTTRKISVLSYKNALTSAKHNLKIVEKYYPNLIRFAQAHIYLTYWHTLDLIILNKINNYKFIQVLIYNLKRNLIAIILNPAINFKEKIAIVILIINRKIYEKCRIFHKKYRLK